MTKRRQRLTFGRARGLIGSRVEYEAACAPGEVYHCVILEAVSASLIKVHFDDDELPIHVSPNSLYLVRYTELQKDDTIDTITEHEPTG